MFVTVRLFGRELFTFEAGVTTQEEVAVEPEGITSGSSHNFERLPEPDVYYEERSSGQFGFGVNTVSR